MDKLLARLPNSVIDKLNSKNIDITLKLIGHSCETRAPSARVKVNNTIVFDGKVIDNQEIQYSQISETDSTTIQIEFYNKQPYDTKVDNNGNILSNQSLHINKFILNGADIIRNGFIYRGKFNMMLDQGKQEYYKNHNLSIESNDFNFYENGIWTLPLELPVLQHIININKKLETFEKIPYNELVEQIIDKCEI